MKITTLFALLAFVLLLSNCGKEKNPNGTPPVSTLEMTKVLTVAEDKFIEFGKTSGTTPQGALGHTAEWLKTQPNISSATVVEDNSGINIKLTSGMKGVISLDIMGKDGLSISRGGGTEGTLLKVMSTKPSKNKIENKKVLLCYPNQDEFYSEAEVKKIIDRLKGSSLGLEVTEKVYEEVSPDLVSTFGNYGLVILNTHGSYPDCFLSGSRVHFDEYDSTDLLVRKRVIEDFSQKTYDDLTSGLLRFGISIRTTSGPDWIKKYTKTRDGFMIYIGGEYINNLPDMPNTIIFGNFCYSGCSNSTTDFPDPIGEAFESKDLISYYCYDDGKGESYRVDNDFAKAMEDSLTKAFVIDNDSTGNAHLSYTDTEYKEPFTPGFFKQYGARDYSYGDCNGTFTDSRDGIIYKTVCIGKQSWMAENLRFNASGSSFYKDDPANGTIYGKLYGWTTVMKGASSSTKNPSGVQGICPEGWHLPSESEWQQLSDYLGGADLAGKALKSDSGWYENGNGTNASGFNALPSGIFNGIHWNQQTLATLFCSTTELSTDSSNAQFFYLDYLSGKALIKPFYKTAPGATDLLASARCLKDK